jgi:hypothetical protein
LYSSGDILYHTVRRFSAQRGGVHISGLHFFKLNFERGDNHDEILKGSVPSLKGPRSIMRGGNQMEGLISRERRMK